MAVGTLNQRMKIGFSQINSPCPLRRCHCSLHNQLLCQFFRSLNLWSKPLFFLSLSRSRPRLLIEQFDRCRVRLRILFTLLLQCSFIQLVEARRSSNCYIFLSFISNLTGMDHVVCVTKLVQDSDCDQTIQSALGAMIRIVGQVVVHGGMPCIRRFVEFVSQIGNGVGHTKWNESFCELDMIVIESQFE